MRGKPPELRQRAIALLIAGRQVSSVARELEVSRPTVYAWRRAEPGFWARFYRARRDRFGQLLDQALSDAEAAQGGAP